MSALAIVLDGRLLDANSARVSVLDRGFLYGDAVSETTRARGRIAFALETHLDRLELSCRELALPMPSRASLRADATYALLSLGPAEEHAALRFQVTRGASGVGLDDVDPEAPPTVLVTARSIAAPKPRATVTVARADTAFSAPFPAKVTSYAATIRARVEARRRGKDDVLFVTPGGNVIEGGSSNVVAIVGTKVRAPLAGALDGITRRIALELASGLGFDVNDGPLAWQELLDAEEAFLTSSLRGVARIVSVDGAPLPAHGATGDALCDAYFARFMRETAP